MKKNKKMCKPIQKPIKPTLNTKYKLKKNTHTHTHTHKIGAKRINKYKRILITCTKNDLF